MHGAAYLCSPYTMQQLDIFEGVATDCYRRALVRVTTKSGEELDCVVYVGESFLEEDDRPSDRYLNAILTGAAEHGLPPEVIESIAQLARAHGPRPDRY